MESDVTESASFYKLWAWFETNKKQVTYGTVAAAVLGLVIWFVLYQREQKAIAADEALSAVFVPQTTGSASKGQSASAYLKVASEYPNSTAAARAILLAGGSLFAEGKFAEAQAQFERFNREHRSSPLLPEAQLGVASCYDALGKTNEAITAYKALVDRRSSESTGQQAKFALGRIYTAQGKPELALPLYEDIARTDPYGSLGSEAGMRAEELKQQYPQLAPPPVVMTNMMPSTLTFSNSMPMQPSPKPAAQPATQPVQPSTKQPAPATAPK